LGLRVFAVVMDLPNDQLAQIIQKVGPDVIQLHGHEEPASIENTGASAVVKALSWTGRAQEAALAKLWSAQARRLPMSFLVDAYAPGVGGGTGKVARWELLNPKPAELADVPMLLAGGLTPENVARAIGQTNCDGVDTASGVESAPGIKQQDLVEAFVRAAQAAFGHPSPRR
jgi:phosphoribosylanthranilate isomerase